MTTFSRALIELTIAAPVDEVWKSLRDPERIGQWFGWDSDSLPAEIDFIFFQRATGDEGARTLAFGLGDRVEIEPRGADTVLRIVRPAPTAEHDWDEIFEDMTQGWIAFFLQMRFALERHASDKRRTLFLSGSSTRSVLRLAEEAILSGAVHSFHAATELVRRVLARIAEFSARARWRLLALFGRSGRPCRVRFGQLSLR